MKKQKIMGMVVAFLLTAASAEAQQQTQHEVVTFPAVETAEAIATATVTETTTEATVTETISAPPQTATQNFCEDVRMCFEPTAEQLARRKAWQARLRAAVKLVESGEFVTDDELKAAVAEAKAHADALFASITHPETGAPPAGSDDGDDLDDLYSELSKLNNALKKKADQADLEALRGEIKELRSAVDAKKVSEDPFEFGMFAGGAAFLAVDESRGMAAMLMLEPVFRVTSRVDLYVHAASLLTVADAPFGVRYGGGIALRLKTDKQAKVMFGGAYTGLAYDNHLAAKFAFPAPELAFQVTRAHGPAKGLTARVAFGVGPKVNGTDDPALGFNGYFVLGYTIP